VADEPSGAAHVSSFVGYARSLSEEKSLSVVALSVFPHRHL